mgnify:CR=1 FL=1
MAGKGGYQKPANPAPISNPGAGSQRTDGNAASQLKQAVRQIPSQSYGDATDFADIQSSAAMEKAAPVRAMSPSAIADAAQQVQGAGIIPLNAPTTMPNQPVTHGADAGPGPGTESLGLNTADNLQNAMFKAQLASYMPALMFIASRDTTSPETRNIIRQLRENM